MSFLHPTLLWWLPLALLPVVLHLLGKRRRRERPFPWVGLLAEAQREGRYRSRPVEWLILALRVLALALVIVALAGPRWGPLPIFQTIAVDLSGSMQGLWPSVAQELQEIRERWPEARWVYFADRRLDRYQITSLRTRYQSLQQVSTPALVLSDGQASGLVGLGSQIGPWVVTLLGDSSRSNVALEELTPVAPYTLKGFPVRVRVRLRNYGSTPARRILSLQGQETLHRQVEVPAHGEWEDEIAVLPDGEGRIQASLRPEDPLPCDDHREGVVYTVAQQSLAWVGPPSPVLQALLEPQGVEPLFQVHRFPKLSTPAQVAPYAVVILHRLPAPDPTSPLATWLRNPGQRVLVFDGQGTWAPLLGVRTDSLQSLRVQGETVRARPLTPPPSGRVWVRCDNGQALVVEQGRVVLFGLDPDRAGPWVLTPDFVQLFYRLAVQDTFQVWTENGVPAGKSLVFPLPSEAHPPFVLEGPSGTQVLTPQVQAGRPVLTCTPIQQGFYRVLTATDTLARFTVVCPQEESDPTPASLAQWQQALAPGSQVLPWEQLRGVRNVDLRAWLLMAALLALALEALLLRWK